MKSFDVFDTLIGRKYCYPDSIFHEMEKELGFENFTWWRKHSESLATDKTLDGIYEKFMELSECSRGEIENFKLVELQKEIEHSFPIIKNIRKVSSEDVLVSDTYLNVEQLGQLLKANGITSAEYGKLITSYDGKSSGRFWHNFNSEHHLGDNRLSDFDNPIRFGTPATLFDTWFSETENLILDRGFHRLAFFCRMIRLMNPYDSTKEPNKYKVWEEQSQINFPLLFMVANYLNREESKSFAFMQRDCCFLYPIFNKRFPDRDSKPLFASRFLLQAPTKTFDEYMESSESEFDWDETLIVDLQGTGDSIYSYLGGNINYFTAVNSNLGTQKFSFKYLVRRTDGFSDKIERLNYAKVGRTVNVRQVHGKWESVNEYLPENDYLNVMESFRNTCLERMNGFDFEGSEEFDLDLFINLMVKLEQDCVICGLVNHEEI